MDFFNPVSYSVYKRFSSDGLRYFCGRATERNADILNTPKSWQIIDIVVGIITLLIGAHLLIDWFNSR